MPTERPLDQHTPEEAIAAFVDAVRRSPERRSDLVELLPEGAPLYAGRSANTANRIKGYILAAFEQVGLPEAALPYALEELESGRNAYAVAAAAKALRGLESPTGQLVPFLMRAIENVRYVDDAVSFEGFRPQRLTSSHTTALAEILATLTWLGAHARSALPGLEALRTKEETLPAATRAAKIGRAHV
jgi:protein SCO1/2